MKKKLIILGISTLLLTLPLTGCFEGFKNNIAKNGGITSSAGDYIVINQSGGKIMDVYKLKDRFVQSETGSDGWNFKDDAGNVIMLGGDIKVIRVYDSRTWDDYKEFHTEFDGEFQILKSK